MVNFKRLELQGFKSFAGKTVIDFTDTFTGIVGPNGCGKSNVADAVRWVLGEMSAKALRGTKMQDVIFNGTEKRPSMSYCEVSLVFDNSNHIFKTDREEVTVTRKLYRNGTSEYYLNHNICRLRDILDIMRDTGAGKDGYSIIGQGKVAEIVNAKPIDRRQIFEEAAGIAKTKAEKIETERKLARASEDIARLTDISTELERQMGPLAKQRDAAQKFFEYKEQMRYQEVNLYLHSCESSVAKKEQVKKNVAAFGEELTNKEAENTRLMQQHNACLEEVDNIEKGVRALMEERERLKVSNEKNSGLMAVHKNKIANLTAERDRLSGELDARTNELDVISETLKEAKGILDIRKGEAYLADQRVNKISDSYFAVSEEIAGTEISMERNSSEVFDVFGRLSDVKSTLASYTVEAGSLTERRNALQEELRSCGAVIEREEAAKQKSADSIKALSARKQQLHAKRAEDMGAYNDARQLLYSLNTQFNSLNAEYANKEGRVHAMADIVGQHDGYQYAVKQLLNDAANDKDLARHVEGVVGQLIKVPQKYEIAIEAALGAAVQHIVTPTDDDAIYIVGYLKKQGYGVATMIPANKARPQELAFEYRGVLSMRGCHGICTDLITFDKCHADVISQLLGRTVIAEDIECAKDMANRYDYGVKIVTLEGDIIDPRRTITGGSRNKKSAYYLSKERELSEAKEELKQLFIKRENMRKQVETAEADAKKLEESIISSKDTVQQIDIEMTAASERIATSERLIAETDERMKRLQAEFDEVDKRLESVNREIENAKGLNQDIEGKKQSAEGLVKLTKEQTEAKRKLRDNLATALTSAKVELSSLQSEVSQIEGDIKRFEGELDAATLDVSTRKMQLENAKVALQNEMDNAPELELSLAEQKRIAEIEEELQAKDNQKTAVRNTLAETDKTREVLIESINQLMDKRAREESRIEKIDAELQSLRDRVLGEYELSDEQMQALRDVENFVPSAAPSAINSLRGKIAQLGSINFNAFDDYETVRVRYEELSTQLADLVKARDDLEKLISAMTKDMVAKFNVAFEQINNNFKKTFADMFGGGSAELVQVDTDNEEGEDAEKGVDINVKLPGKAHQNLQSLSGGEQALTSIAILFAILRLRPMPFSILDEIEAALDESNAILLANYLKKYSRDTQFIVITHKKPVMEVADVLYGVTMEERGVSKVITVKISDAVASMEA